MDPKNEEVTFLDFNKLVVRRSQLEPWFHQAGFHATLIGLFVKIPVKDSNGKVVYRVFSIAKVIKAESDEPYQFGGQTTIHKLHVVMPTDKKNIQAKMVSDREVTEEEFLYWQDQVKKAHQPALRKDVVAKKLLKLSTFLSQSQKDSFGQVIPMPVTTEPRNLRNEHPTPVELARKRNREMDGDRWEQGNSQKKTRRERVKDILTVAVDDHKTCKQNLETIEEETRVMAENLAEAESKAASEVATERERSGELEAILEESRERWAQSIGVLKEEHKKWADELEFNQNSLRYETGERERELQEQEERLRKEKDDYFESLKKLRLSEQKAEERRRQAESGNEARRGVEKACSSGYTLLTKLDNERKEASGRITGLKDRIRALKAVTHQAEAAETA